MSWDIFSKSKIQYFLEKLKGKFVQKETGKGLSSNDYTTTDKNKVALIDNTTTSATGNPVSIADLKSAQIALNPVITFEPIQAGSGTSSPSNIRAISGYDKIEVLSCGKNLFDIDKVIRNRAISVNGNNISITPVGYNTDLFSGNTGESGASAKKLYLKAGTYAISFSFVGTAPQLNSIYVNTIDETTLIPNGNIGRRTSGQTFVITESSWICLKLVSNATCTLKDIQIEENNQATTYEPYHKTTDLSESLGQTVYGGSLDVRMGIFRVSWVKRIYNGDSSETWKKSTNAFYIAAHDLIKVLDYANSIKCDKLQLTSYFNIVDGSITNAIAGYRDSGGAYPGQNWFYIGVSGISDVASLKTWLSNNPIEVCYAVATPTEIQLTPHEIALSQGYNYISTNGTSISLAYHNGEVATHADVEQLSETLNNGLDCLKDYVEANKQTSQVNLVPYGASNLFTFPYDGYIIVSSATASSGKIEVDVFDSVNNTDRIALLHIPITTTNQRQSLFVRKGMRAYVRDTIPSGAQVTYRGLTI